MKKHRQRGAVMVLVVVGLLALIGIAGLAIDTAHVLLNKSRLQSALDAAALAAAKVLDQTASTTQATAAAGSVFTLNLAQYSELRSAVGSGLAMTTEYSSTLIPFSPGTAPALFVRATITGFPTVMSLASVLGITSINVTGSAVAGPSPPLGEVCNIVPIMMCGTAGAGAPLFGYSANQVLGLNQVAGTSSAGLGPGNYNLLAVGGSGAATVRTNFAGDYGSCASVGKAVTTEPGVAAGPVSQGWNTRFNQYQGPVSAAQYPPDVINSAAHQTNLTGDTGTGIKQGGTTITGPNGVGGAGAGALTFNWSNYNALLPSGPYDTQPLPNGPAAFQRRVVAAPIGDCSTAVNGKGSVNVLGFGCLFLLQTVNQGGKQVLYAQVLKACDAGGRPGSGPPAFGPHVIELYKSAGSPDS
jgi:Putative Flp pilus-assembly TadE/G-like